MGKLIRQSCDTISISSPWPAAPRGYVFSVCHSEAAGPKNLAVAVAVWVAAATETLRFAQGDNAPADAKHIPPGWEEDAGQEGSQNRVA